MVDIAWQPGQDTLGLFLASILRESCRLSGPVNFLNEETGVGAIELTGRPRKSIALAHAILPAKLGPVK